MNPRDLLEADALRAFVAFAHHLNFTRAAEDLNLSQPSLHVKIRKLATALGVALYERQGRRLELTRHGQSLARFARDSQRHVDDFLADLRGESAQPLILASGRGAYLYVLGGAVERFLAGGSRLELTIADQAGTLHALRSGACDLGIAVVSAPPTDLESRVVASFPQMLAVAESHRLADRRDIGLQDLEGESLVLPPAGRPHRQALARALHSAGVRWRLAVEAEGWDLLVHFTALGLGSAVINGCVTVPRGVRKVPIRDLPAIEYRAIFRQQRASRAQPFLELLGRSEQAS